MTREETLRRRTARAIKQCRNLPPHDTDQPRRRKRRCERIVQNAWNELVLTSKETNK